MPPAIKTSGVYIVQPSDFPPSIVSVQTAVPAFVGYTQNAESNGRPVLNQPVQITSMADFESTFGGPYQGTFHLSPATDPAHKFDFLVPTASGGQYLDLDDPALRFHLYASMKLFFGNGGADCYVVSVGNYATAPTKEALLAGLQALSELVGPTMLAIPDAVLLPPDNSKQLAASAAFQALAQAMLQQAQSLQDRIAILDVYGATLIGKSLSSGAIVMDDVIAQFRQDVGDGGLSYGAAYFPFLATAVFQPADFDFTCVSPIDDPTAPADLRRILTTANNATNPAGAQLDAMQHAIDSMATVAATGDAAKIRQLTQQLSTLPVMQQILAIVATRTNVLPPSGAMVGVMTANDQARGVWNAPANVTVSSVVNTTLPLSDEQQGQLNVPLDGKAINTIRDFVHHGPTVWGARTLDGNSNDWRYLQVRRTMIYVDQSIKNALSQFVFAPNNGNTWVAVTSTISSFLTGLWSQGALMGAKASDAFTVQCGLGSTMTSQDILEGYIVVAVTLQIIHPAEFMELTFRQKMQSV